MFRIQYSEPNKIKNIFQRVDRSDSSVTGGYGGFSVFINLRERLTPHFLK